MNLKQKVVISFILLLGLFACNQKKETKEISKPSVVIFEQPLYPLNVKTPFKNITPVPTEVPVISYSSGEAIKYYNPKKADDILILDNPNSYAELRFACSFEDYSFLIAPNDTILFSIDEYGHPTLKSKTSEQLTKLYNFPYRIKHSIPFLDYRPLTGLLRFGRHLVIIKKAKKEMPSLYQKFKHTYIPIDTLQKSFLLYQEKYFKELEDLKRKSDIPNEYIDYLSYRYELNNYLFELSKVECQKGKLEKITINTFFKDEFSSYPSYHCFISKFLLYYFNKKEGTPILKQKNGSDPDWRKTYEKIAAKDYPVKTKQLMQKFSLKQMSKLFSAKSIKKQLDDYLLQTGDSATVNDIVSPLRISISEKKLAAESLLLRDMQGNTTTLKKVLYKYKGSVMYVDFWASWCVPCMSLMPDSKELHQRYARRKVKFIYFSMDENESVWKHAAKKIGIKENNYLILNAKEAPFIKEINLGSIPRFLVFDKEGKLVDKNAPRPNEGKIEMILDKYLAQ